jgi:hypothetical protein
VEEVQISAARLLQQCLPQNKDARYPEAKYSPLDANIRA